MRICVGKWSTAGEVMEASSLKTTGLPSQKSLIHGDKLMRLHHETVGYSEEFLIEQGCLRADGTTWNPHPHDHATMRLAEAAVVAL